MADPLTTNMQLSVPTRGSDVGTWDTPNNGDWLVVDAAFGAVSAISLSSSNVALTVAQAQSSVLRFSGALGANVTVSLPAIQKFWIVENNTTGAFTVTLSGGGKVVGLPPGDPADVYFDGTDVKLRNLGRTGKMEFWRTSALPAWVTACTVQPYLILDGSTFNATTYAALNAFLGGNTLDDYRSRVPVPLDNMGAHGAAGRIGTVGTIVGTTLGSAGGASTYALSLAETPSFAYTPAGNISVTLTSGTTATSFATFNISGLSGGPVLNVLYGNSNAVTVATQSFAGTPATLGGSNNAHPILQPSMMSGIFVIKT